MDNITPLLVDLEVIKQLQENDKLAVCVLPGDTRLIVHSNWALSGLTRKYYGYDRESCIKYLEELKDKITKMSSMIIEGSHEDIGNILKKAIGNAVPGLNNLKNTYKDDSVINAKISLISERLITTKTELEAFTQESIDILNNINLDEESDLNY